MMEQPTLFNPRQGIIDATLDKADDAFKSVYLSLLMEFIRSGKEFIGENVQDEYRRRKLPEPKNWRAVGGMYQRLIREGKMYVVGYGKRNQGNPSPKYRGRA